jgi:hypothetical protein
MRPKQKMVPSGILEVENDFVFLFFSLGRNTSDFLGVGSTRRWTFSGVIDCLKSRQRHSVQLKGVEFEQDGE